MSKRHFSVGQQTRALLGKNFLKKWRMKRETLSESLFSCLLVLFALLLSSNLHQVNDFPQLPAVDLGRVDNFNDSDYVIAFAPESKTTQEIMNKLASAPFIKGRPISGWPDEQSMGELELNYSADAVRVIFNDAFSYHLKFLWGHRIPTMKEHGDHSAHCQVMDESVMCEGSLFWEKGFVGFQAAINAAIIEITTNHSVMEKLMSVTGINMKILPFVAQAGVMTDFFHFLLRYFFFCLRMLRISQCDPRKTIHEASHGSDGTSRVSLLAVLGSDVRRLHLRHGRSDGSDSGMCPSGGPDGLHGGLHPLSPLRPVLDNVSFPDERVGEEALPDGAGGLPPHCLLGEPGIHSFVQTPSCGFGVDLMSSQPLCFHCWNGPAYPLGLRCEF